MRSASKCDRQRCVYIGIGQYWSRTASFPGARLERHNCILRNQ